MKNLSILFTILAGISVMMFSNCINRPSASDLKSVKRLEGDWVSTPESGFYESWILKNDKQMFGLGFSMDQTDTLFSEQLEIFASDSGVYYKALVQGQNEELPMYFKLTHQEDDSLVFSNPAHDFPRFIIYKIFHEDSLRIDVRDGIGETSKGFQLIMIKMAC
ncbi:MAG: hypothetical protein IH597_13945 [Bacteroidales bacterium]|nr:hypothetical protein [Bacteroidales bacterium]